MRVKCPLLYSKLAKAFQDKQFVEAVSRDFRLTKREAWKARRELVELGLLPPQKKRGAGGRRKLRDKV